MAWAKMNPAGTPRAMASTSRRMRTLPRVTSWEFSRGGRGDEPECKRQNAEGRMQKPPTSYPFLPSAFCLLHSGFPPPPLCENVPEMSMAASPKSPPPDWSRLVGDSLKQNGVWHTWGKLSEARTTYPDDLSLRGYCEIVRNIIVRDFLTHPKGMQ